MRTQREQVPPSVIADLSLKIYEYLVEWPIFQAAQCVACYVSIQNEVDTHPIIDHAWSHGKTVCVPVALAKHQMAFQKIANWDALKPARFGLLEPVFDTRDVIAPNDLDLILVPGVAFDGRGNRLGFGSGFYDRFLSDSSVVCVGLAYAFQVVAELPTESHDVQMDWLVTEEGMVACRKKT